MAGHSKWANRKHRKSRVDAQRGKIFTKLSRELTVAAREGGGDPESNVRLRMAIEKAKDNNMPNQNIERAIQKGTGAQEGSSYESVVLEGYGPGGVALMLEALTDNRNRTVADVRNIFNKYSGNLGEAGCVAWIFERKGYLSLNMDETSLGEEELMSEAIEVGAEDFREEDNYYEIITAPEEFAQVRKALKDREFSFNRAELTMLPNNTVPVSETEEASRLLNLMEALEDHDDVQNVYANFDIPDEILSHMD